MSEKKTEEPSAIEKAKAHGIVAIDGGTAVAIAFTLEKKLGVDAAVAASVGALGASGIKAIFYTFSHTWNQLVAGYSSAKKADPSEMALALEEAFKHEVRAHDILQAYRRASNAHDPSVVAFLGRLLGLLEMEQLEGGRRFFRGFGSVLEELDEADLEALRDFVVKLRPYATDETPALLVSNMPTDSKFRLSVTANLETSNPTHDIGESPSLHLQFHLLRTTWLGTGPVSYGAHQVNDAHHVALASSNIRDMIRVLCIE